MSTSDVAIRITAQDGASSVFAKLRSETQATSTAFARLAPALAGAFSVASVVAFTRSTVAGIDALNDLKDATGASVENLSALEDIALRTGTSMDSAGDAVVKLNKALNSASDPKSGAALAIQALGLSIQELKALDPVVALQKVGVALAGFADDGNKGRIIMELLGKSTKQLAPLLKDLAEAGKLQGTVTAEQALQAEEFRKRSFALQKDLTDLARTLAGPVVQSMNQFTSAIHGGGLLKDMDDLLSMSSLVGTAFLVMGKTIGGVLAQAAALSHGDFAGAAAIGQAMLDDATAVKAEYAKAQKLKQLLADAPQASYSNEGRNYPKKSLPSTLGGGGSGPKGRATKDRVFDPGTEATEAMKDALKAIEGTDVVKIEKLNAALQELFNLRASGLGGDAGIDAAIERLRDELEKLDPAAQKAIEAKRRLDSILASTPAGTMKGVLADIDLINKAFDAGKISAELWAEAAGEITSKLKSAGDTGKTVGEDLAMVFTSAAGNAIQHWTGVRDLLKGILQDIAQLALKQAVLQPLSNSLSGAFEGFSWASIFAGGRASGGPVSAGRMYQVNERGPGELLNVGNKQYLMAGQGGSVSPAGGGMVFPTTINIDARTDQAQVAQMVVAGMQQTEKRMWASMRARGVA